ncbi:DUF4232 domain-containing protein [Glycomyces tarimensis]
MIRVLRLLAPILTAGLLLSACGAGGSEAVQAPEDGTCPDSGLDVSATPAGEASNERFLAIGLVNCGDVPHLLDSHPNVGVFGGDIAISRDGNVPESVTVDPGQTLVAPLSWTTVAEDAEDTITVDRLLVNALPEPTGYTVEIEPAFELAPDHVLDLGAWQHPADTEPVPDDTETPAEEPAPDAGACTEEGFQITITEPSAAMGIRAVGIDLVNCGAEAIEVNGYPVVEVLHGGATIEVEVHEGSGQLTDPGPTAITVEPGGSVSAGMLWRNKVESADPADVVNATALAMTYAEGAPTIVVTPSYPIDLGTTRYLEVTAWR